MPWAWKMPKQYLDFGAEFDPDASRPTEYVDDLSEVWLDPAINRPVFRSRTALRKFKKLHCPPFGSGPAVDAVWREIILSFVPEDRIQFLPIRLIARGEVCDDYYWPIVFDRAYCIDPERSVITQKIQKFDELYIIRVAKFVHLPNCLGDLHIARDARMSVHLVVSDALKDALSATGEDSMFFRPEDIGQIR